MTLGNEADAACTKRRAGSRPAHRRRTAELRVYDGIYLTRAEPPSSPHDRSTADMVNDLRDELGDGHLVGGRTAAYVDFSDVMADRFPAFRAVVLVSASIR